MHKKAKKVIHTLIGFCIGGIFLYFTLRGKDFNIILENIKKTDILWLAFSLVLLILIFFLRALRWKILLSENNIHKSTKRVFTSVLQGYFVNSFTPKLGEIVRCTSLNIKDDKQLAQSLGSVVAERAYDLIILCLGLLIILVYEFDRLKDFLFEFYNKYYFLLQYTYIILSCVVILVSLAYFAIKQLRKTKGNRIAIFANRLLDSLKQGFFIKKNKEFVLLTIGIWICLILLNYTYLRCIPSTNNLSISFAAVILFVGGIGWALPSPGGIGTTHFIILQIFLIYNLDSKLGITFGIISNGLTLITTLVLGLLAWAYHTYKNVKGIDY